MNVVPQMGADCLSLGLLDFAQAGPTVTMKIDSQMEDDNPATYSSEYHIRNGIPVTGIPLTRSIQFSSVENINEIPIIEELAHAAQHSEDPLYFVNSANSSSGYFGGPNVEFEAKFLDALWAAKSGLEIYDESDLGTPGLNAFVSTLLSDHNGNLPIELSPEENAQYFTLMNQFRAQFIGPSSPAGSSAYNGIIDTTRGPVTAMQIIVQSSCTHYY